jgi:carboxylate-amine ligase
VLERLGPAPGAVEAELHACQVELITDPCRSAGEAVRVLSGLRAAVLRTGVSLLGSGTHPQKPEGPAAITEKERYELIRDRLGDAVATPVGGLHVHVGMPDPDTAIRAFNGLRRHLPLLQALAANSPYRYGRDSGLQSAREISIRGWPRSGVPRAMADLADFADIADRLARAAEVPDYTWFWWKLRPHPRLGTVEIRALDAQTTLRDASGLIALTHCLARHEAEAEPAEDPTSEVIEAGNFLAARFGIRARLPDAEGRMCPFDEVLAQALEMARPHAAELGCVAELGRLEGLVAIGGGAGRQRTLHERVGIDGLAQELMALTVPAS